MNSFEGSGVEGRGMRPIDMLNAERQNIYMMGGNDSEISVVDTIIARFRNGEISQEDALAEILAVKGNKNDYH